MAQQINTRTTEPPSLSFIPPSLLFLLLQNRQMILSRFAEAGPDRRKPNEAALLPGRLQAGSFMSLFLPEEWKTRWCDVNIISGKEAFKRIFIGCSSKKIKLMWDELQIQSMNRRLQRGAQQRADRKLTGPLLVPIAEDHRVQTSFKSQPDLLSLQCVCVCGGKCVSDCIVLLFTEVCESETAWSREHCGSVSAMCSPAVAAWHRHRIGTWTPSSFLLDQQQAACPTKRSSELKP